MDTGQEENEEERETWICPMTDDIANIIPSCADCKNKNEDKNREGNTERTKKTCKYFIRGWCRYGKNCKTGPHRIVICKYYQENKCKFGEKCINVHTKRTGQHKTEICKYFQENRCKYGDKCMNSHNEQINNEKSTSKNNNMEIKEAIQERQITKDTGGILRCSLCNTKFLSWKQQ